MIVHQLLVGLPAMLLCLIVQAAVAFWSVRYYVGQSNREAGIGRAILLGIRPLLVVMLVMMLGKSVQIMLWGVLFLWLGEFERAV